MKSSIFKKAIEKWGIASQMRMLIEESSEVIQAACKHMRNPSKHTLDDLIEESADTYIMCLQMRELNPKHFDFTVQAKLNRVSNKIKEV